MATISANTQNVHSLTQKEKETIKKILASGNAIDFNLVWPLLGYVSKNSACAKLKTPEFLSLCRQGKSWLSLNPSYPYPSSSHCIYTLSLNTPNSS
jgi:hypothetical protein